ncbi:MAG: hypothetical protein VKI83_07515 [Synechococcaceae cyanobacterium]|nr:hypothetical protein [Synechococcaceae cyanobacterium]
MPLRRHRLPRFWLLLTLGSVLVAIGAAQWWERQLPARLQQAEQRGDLDACLRYSSQLAALSWLPGGSPRQEGECRRRKALLLWQRGDAGGALALQRELLQSRAGAPADARRLNGWQAELRSRALQRYQGGDLSGALALLSPLRSGGADAADTAAEYRETWERNRQQLQRADRLSRSSRWWEALDALNRLDHPWWRRQAEPVRTRVQNGIASLRGADREHDSHGALPHTVPAERLDALVRKRIAAGMEEWKAFETSCRELGGRVVEAGPDSACQVRR